jgi:hypothetical protein
MRIYTNNGRKDYSLITPDYEKIKTMLTDCYTNRDKSNSQNTTRCPLPLQRFGGSLLQFLAMRMGPVTNRVRQLCRIIQCFCDPVRSKEIIRDMRTWNTQDKNKGLDVKGVITRELAGVNSPLRVPREFADRIRGMYNSEAKFYNKIVGGGGGGGGGGGNTYGYGIVEGGLDRFERSGKDRKRGAGIQHPGGYYRKRISRKNSRNRNTRKHRRSNRNTRKSNRKHQTRRH